MTASAVGYTNTTALVTVLDNDLLNLSLSIVPSTFSEAAGQNAAVGKVTRDQVTDQPLTVKLFTANTSKATVPATIVIPANQDSATFAIAAVDNTVPDGTSTVTISADGAYPEWGCTILTGGATNDVTGLDNEQPALQVTLSKSLVYEDAGAASVTGTVTERTHNRTTPSRGVMTLRRQARGAGALPSSCVGVCAVG